MSSLSKVTITRIDNIRNHENADALEITNIFGFPVVIRKGQYIVGDLVAYIPPDMVVSDEPEFQFLGDKKRIKAAKIRGIMSYGLVVPARPHHQEGMDVTDELKVKPYVEHINIATGGDIAQAPHGEIKYTDIESLRKYHRLLMQNEEVVITEKVHGMNLRFVYQNGQLHCGTHRQWLKQGKNVPWAIAEKYSLKTKLKDWPDVILFGEGFGWVQDIRYGASPGEYFFIAFDAFFLEGGKYEDYHEFIKLCDEDLFLPTAPELYRGPWKSLDDVKHLAEGKSVLADNIKEGFVVRPIRERFDESIGRVILKLHGDDYLTRKGKR